MSEVGFEARVAQLRQFYESGTTRPLGWRTESLLAIKARVESCKREIIEGYKKDLGRCVRQSIYDYAPMCNRIDVLVRNIAAYAAVRKSGTSYQEVRYEPKGVVLCVGPWNYPLTECVKMVCAAIVAGNCAVLKPSEKAPEMEKVCVKLFAGLPGVEVFTGGVPQMQRILNDLQFDHIVFVGSPAVGKMVAKAAAERLTPVTLELGGKNPAIFDSTLLTPASGGTLSKKKRNLIRRLLFIKHLNAGQVCTAVDYIICKEKDADLLATTLAEVWDEMCTSASGGEAALSATVVKSGAAYANSKDSIEKEAGSPDLARLLDKASFDRVCSLLRDTHGGKVIRGGLPTDFPVNQSGGRIDNERFVPLTIVKNPALTSKLMQEEVFGPVVSVLTVSEDNDKAFLQRAAAIVNAPERRNPLVLHVFSMDSSFCESALTQIPSGDATFCASAVYGPESPQGGIGRSGHGNISGESGFRELSHTRTVINHLSCTDQDDPLIFPPYDTSVDDALEIIAKGYFLSGVWRIVQIKVLGWK
ncbi:unnamed protein product [Amoebophrya sp. A25]|nr:unnamed protein product [Amoebophrya sp. A25]|eukprot:GSA25T00011700001.1